MALTVTNRSSHGVRLSGGELTGALGDSVTALPLVVAVGVATEASLAHLLVGFAVFQVVWGLHYGLPLSVEPMKALAGLAIAGALSYPELVAAGLLAGGVLLVAGRLGLVARLAGVLGQPVVRGVQLAVALALGVTGLELVGGDPALAVAGIVLGGLAWLVDRRLPAIVVLASGTIVAGWAVGVPVPTVPSLAPFPGGLPSLTRGALSGLVGQLAMTVANAAIATSLLLDDLFDADVSPDSLAESMGLTNLAALPFGALPMCHGSGGLAGKHGFGARTGGANLLLGGLYAAAALIAGLWTAFPMAMLGVLLVVVAVSLGRVALQEGPRALVIGIGVAGVVLGIGVGTVLGVLAHRIWVRTGPRNA